MGNIEIGHDPKKRQCEQARDCMHQGQLNLPTAQHGSVSTGLLEGLRGKGETPPEQHRITLHAKL